MRKALQLALSLAVFAIAACGDPASPEPTMAGSWSGSGGGITMSLTLSQNGTAVSGNGSMSGSGGAAALTVTGSFASPNFSLTVSAQGYENFNYAGTLSGNSATGVLNGSGFNQAGMTLTRK